MKKHILFLIVFLAGTGFAFSQSKTPTLEDVFTLLDENFAKFEWVHQQVGTKTEDDRAFIKIIRQPYDMPVDRDGEEIMTKGEINIIQIVKGGYRYDLKLDFAPKREKGAERSRTVKNRIYQRLLIDILPSKTS